MYPGSAQIQPICVPLLMSCNGTGGKLGGVDQVEPIGGSVVIAPSSRTGIGLTETRLKATISISIVTST